VNRRADDFGPGEPATVEIATAGSSIASGAPVSASAGTGAFWPVAAIVLLAAAAQVHWGVNPDTSYSLTQAEEMLAGRRPYVDFLEINPPMAFLLALGPTFAARILGATPELSFDLFCFAAAGLSVWLSWTILVRGGIARAPGGRFAVVAVGVLLLLPARVFAQREQIALIAALPCLAALVVCLARGRVAPAFSVLAGLGAGVALSIKPHFALFFLPPLVNLARNIGWRAALMRREPLSALAFFALFCAFTAVAYPEFLANVAPMARDIYISDRMPIGALFGDPILIDWTALIALLAYAARGRWREPLIATPALASAGALAVYLIQGKLWPNHGYPALALAALALGPLVLENLASRRAGRNPRTPLTVDAGFAVVVALALYWLSWGDDSAALEHAVAATAPHPRVLAISPLVQTGHPLTRRIGGVWVGYAPSLVITEMSQRALSRSPNDAALYEPYLDLDRRRLVADIVDNRPDAILVAGKTWLAWAQSHPDVAAALAAYHLGETADHVMVYARNDAGR